MGVTRIFILSILIVTSSFIGLAFSHESTPLREYVVTLDYSNFTEFVSKHNFMVVEFYAPWCGACKSLAPEWEKAAKILSEGEPPIVLAKVDANDARNKDVAVEHDLKGFPTIKILKEGGTLVRDYKGPRDAHGIVAYVRKQAGPPSLEIKSIQDAAAIIHDDDDFAIVGIFPEFSGEKYDSFTALAERLRSGIDFGHTTDAKLLPRGDLSVNRPVIRLFKPFDELFVDFEEFDVDVLEKLIEESSMPLVTLFNMDPVNRPYLTKFFQTPSAKVMMFLNFTSANFGAFKSKYREVAEEFKGNGVGFLMGDIEAARQGTLEFLGLKEDQMPLVVIQTNDGSKYLKQNLLPGQIFSFVKEFKDGKLQLYKKSEPIPEVNDEPVKVVVHDSFEDMVFNSGKNVVLTFYGSWSPHTKMFAPILDEVAVAFQNDNSVMIAKIDTMKNDYPTETFEVVSDPALYFVSASGEVTSMLEEEGVQSKEAIIAFIQNNLNKAPPQPHHGGHDEL
ncbi:hypothetical protein Leryth_011614 [Lithospermum erythrorhizon]|nr:hypothetical protein Leryth_011614 [Lithospermum erythrorhizon]